MGCGLWVRNSSKPWRSRRIRWVQRGPAGPDDPPPHQGSLPPGAASLGFYFRPCSLPDLFPSCLPRSHFGASGAPCDVMSPPRPLSLPTGPLTRLPFHHVGAALSLPDFCYTSPHHLAVVVVLILAPGCQPTCGAGASMGHVERGARCCWGAVLCFLLLLCSALPCLLKLSVCVYRAAPSVSRPISCCLCARAAATAAWASTVVCGIAALVCLLPS